MKKVVIGILAGSAVVITCVLVYRRIKRPENYIQIKGVMAELKDSPLLGSLPVDVSKYAALTLAELAELKAAIVANNKQTQSLGYMVFSPAGTDQKLIEYIHKINS